MCTKSSFSICLTQIFFFFLFITALFGVAIKTVLRWQNCVLGLNEFWDVWLISKIYGGQSQFDFKTQFYKSM